jgi:predicted ATPase
VTGIVSAVGGALGIPIGRGDPIEQLGHAMAGRGRCLMILDNFEQVAEHAGATLGRWLEHAPDARCVVTTRERLGLDGERVQPVEPLSNEIGVELFGARARGLRPAHELVGVEADAAREIVRLVDGMPLAIELAAARVRVMSAAQIAAQMRKRFRLLTGGRSARHETLEGAIDGSWELLTPWEQAAWTQCSVFEGGFTLPAAQEVLDLRAWPEAPWALDVIRSLVDKSLLRTWVPRMEPGEGAPETRLGMYVSLREYARFKLRDGAIAHGGDGSSMARAAEERHGRWYARFGTPEQIDGLDRHGGVGRRHALGRELENLVAACQRALSRDDGETAVAAFRAASHVLFLRGPLERVVTLGREVLDRTSGSDHRASTLFLIGWAELFWGRMDEAQQHLEAALALYRELGDRGNEGVASGTLAILLMSQGHMKEAHAHFDRELGIERELGNQVREGITLLNLGEWYRKQGHMEEARIHFEAALGLCRAVGNRRVEGMLLTNLGQLHRRQGRMQEARGHLEAALAVSREVGNRLSEGVALNSLGCIHFDLHDLAVANTHFQAALALHRETGSRFSMGLTVGNLGRLHFEQGYLEEARAEYEDALAIFREVGNPFLEGEALAALGTLHLRQGRLEEAREVLDQGEAVARRVGGNLELGMLLCARAELEHRSGNGAAARTTLEEAQAIAIQVGSGPDSELGRQLAQVRRALGVATREP